MKLDTRRVTRLCSHISLIMLVGYVVLGLLNVIDNVDYKLVWAMFVVSFMLWASQEV